MRLPPRVLALSPGDLAPGDTGRFLAAVDAAVAGGLRGILLREARLDERAFEELARALRTRLDAAVGGEDEPGWLGVHDRVHLAASTGADGVHLGFRSLAPRELPGFARDLTVGFSAHAGDAADAWSGAHYLFYGPVHATPSKAGVVDPVGLDGLAEGVRRAEEQGMDVWALGGVAAEDVADCLRAGARGVAVLRGILKAEDPADAARRYQAAVAEEVA